MRVIAGKAKGRKLMMVPGDSTRPITDRAKEALFSIMGTWIEGTRVLDLFGGTGGVGIESLSRGADFVQFVELNRKAVETIRANLRHCGFEKQAIVERGDSFTYLQRYQGRPYDLIYVAPPQYQGYWIKALQMVDARPELLAKLGSVIVQIHPREDAPVALERLEEYDRRRYGSVMLIFYMTAEDLAAADEDDDAWEDDETGDEEDTWDAEFEEPEEDDEA
ncbi:MAG: 16S rRNA (guanine(966)-N(2))-methyltransferase RsmD [Caldilinea sp.]|nr:16S rRNA (guanine(966)-N(2))-methyltransferase RsmD [Caldilinea sp.]